MTRLYIWAGSVAAVLALLAGAARQAEWVDHPHYWTLRYQLA